MKLDRELHRRGLNYSQFSRVSGISIPTLSRVRNGSRASQRTIDRIVQTLLRTPLKFGVDMLLPDEKESSAVIAPTELWEVQDGATSRPST